MATERQRKEGRGSGKQDWDQTMKNFEGLEVSLHSKNNRQSLTAWCCEFSMKNDV